MVDVCTLNRAIFAYSGAYHITNPNLFASDESGQQNCLPPTVETEQSNVIQSNTEVEVKPPESCNWPRAIQVGARKQSI